MAAMKMRHIHSWLYRSTIAAPWSRSFGINIRLGRRFVGGTRAAFFDSRRPWTPTHDVWKWHCAHCPTPEWKGNGGNSHQWHLHSHEIIMLGIVPDFCGSLAHPYACTARGLAAYRKTSSTNVCQTELHGAPKKSTSFSRRKQEKKRNQSIGGRSETSRWYILFLWFDS